MLNKNNQGLVLKIITNQIQSLNSIVEELDDRIPTWKSKTVRLLQGKVIDEELSILNDIDKSSYDEDKIEYLRFMEQLFKDVELLPGEYLMEFDNNNETERNQKILSSTVTDNIFIVHGHDDISKLEVARTIEKLGLIAIVLHEQPNQGRTIIEKFEANAASAGFAIILLTPDDIGYVKNKEDEKNPRARQNVILELGYFCGLLSRKRVCVLYKDKVEIPSDYLGVVYIPFDDAGSWKFLLAKKMKEVGFSIDTNLLL